MKVQINFETLDIEIWNEMKLKTDLNAGARHSEVDSRNGNDSSH